MKRLSVIIYISLSSACNRIKLNTYRMEDNIDDVAPRERNTSIWINKIQSRVQTKSIYARAKHMKCWKIDNEELLIAINNQRERIEH